MTQWTMKEELLEKMRVKGKIAMFVKELTFNLSIKIWLITSEVGLEGFPSELEAVPLLLI